MSSVTAGGFSRVALTVVLAAAFCVPGVSAAEDAPVIATGVITDAVSGLPIEDAWVGAVLIVGPEEDDIVFAGWAATDADGAYELRGRDVASPGQYRFYVSADTYEARVHHVTWDGGAALEVDFALDPAKVIASGTVRDLITGEPMENTIVEATVVGEPVDLITPVTTVAVAHSASDGTYVLYDEWTHGAGDFTFVAWPLSNSGHVVTEIDAAWDGEAPLEIDFAMRPLTDTYHAVEGLDRFATAIEASKLAYPDGLAEESTKTVVIATGMNWPDALGGTALAGALDAPVLLTHTNTLPTSVLAEIERLGAEKAVILGGTSAVGVAVESALETALDGAVNVDRIAGTDRYDTANKVAARVIELLGDEYDGTAFVATGGNFPDALAAAPLAAAQRWPLFLANPATGLSPATHAAMAEVTDAIILGGGFAVSAQTEAALKGRLGDDRVTRLQGLDRFTTAIAIATYAVDHADHGWDRAGIATGMNFPDALAGGVLQGKVGSVMLLAPPDDREAYLLLTLEGNRDDIDRVTFFGGPAAVSETMRTWVLWAIGYLW